MSKKNAILNVALKQALYDGYAATSMNTIAAEVGISKPAIYYHFPNKVELFRGVVNHFFTLMSQWSKSQSSGVNTFQDFIFMLFSGMSGSGIFIANALGESQPIPHFSVMELLLQAGKDDPQIISIMGDGYRKTRENFASSLAQAQDAGECNADMEPHTIALILLAIVEGMGLQTRFDDTVNRGEAGERIARQLWKWIGKE